MQMNVTLRSTRPLHRPVLTRPIILAVMAMAVSSCASTRTTAPTSLQDKLDRAVAGFRGDVGVYVRHLENGERAAILADTLFPTASMIKVPILIKTFDAIESGALDSTQDLVYRDSLYYPGVDLLGSFKDGETIRLRKVAMLMTSFSDNTASLWLQQLCGGGEAINSWLDEHGFVATRMNSRTPGRQDDWEVYGWGQTSPREIAELLVMIHAGQAVSPAASEEMLRLLSKSFVDDKALSQIPPSVEVASKQGSVDRSRSEVALVYAPHGAYVFSVITKNQQDVSWTPGNEGFALLRRVSRLLWEHFEPQSDWSPAARFSTLDD